MNNTEIQSGHSSSDVSINIFARVGKARNSKHAARNKINSYESSTEKKKTACEVLSTENVVSDSLHLEWLNKYE